MHGKDVLKDVLADLAVLLARDFREREGIRVIGSPGPRTISQQRRRHTMVAVTHHLSHSH
jgi:hypothetical protein